MPENGFYIRKVEEDEFPELFREHITSDFPRTEYPPYGKFLESLRLSRRGLYFCGEDGEKLAYAFIDSVAESRYVMIFLYAVMAGGRGRGTGTRFMQALFEEYGSMDGIILEVEKPEEASSEAERSIRERRISFYQRLGYQMVREIDYCIYGVPMYIMVKPLLQELVQPDELVDEIYRLYRGSMGKNTEKFVSAKVKRF